MRRILKFEFTFASSYAINHYYLRIFPTIPYQTIYIKALEEMNENLRVDIM